MATFRNCLHYYVDLLRVRDSVQRKDDRSGSAICALQNIIRSMRLTRHGRICGEDFSCLDFGNIPLYSIEFYHPDSIPTVFDFSMISMSNLHQLRDGHYRPITSAAISNDGEYLATGSMEPEGKVCIWNTWTKCLVKTIDNPLSWHSGYGVPGIEYLCFSNDGSILCMGNKFGVVVYNLITNIFEIKIEAAVFHNSECLKLSSYYEQVCDLEKAGEALSYYYIISDYDYGSSAYLESEKYAISSLMPRNAEIRLETIRFLSDCLFFALRLYRSEKNNIPNSDIVYEREFGRIEFILDLSNKKYKCNKVLLQRENLLKKHMFKCMKPIRASSANKQFDLTQLSDFEIELLDNSTRMKSVLCLGQTSHIFVHGFEEGIVSRAFNEPSILWDALSLTIISVLDNQLPPAYADQGIVSND